MIVDAIQYSDLQEQIQLLQGFCLPFVRQISIKLTTFSCFRSCRILISRSAVMGN